MNGLQLFRGQGALQLQTPPPPPQSAVAVMERLVVAAAGRRRVTAGVPGLGWRGRSGSARLLSCRLHTFTRVIRA